MSMLKNKLFTTVLLCFALVASPLAFADSASENNFAIPLDTSEAKINLQVAVPTSFKPMPGGPADSPVKVFIPSNETGDKYTQLITVTPMPNATLPASQYIDALIASVQKNSVDLKVVEKDTQQAKSIEETVAIVTYKDPSYNNRDQISIFYATSGPAGLAGVQYVMTVNSGDKIEDLTKNLYDFIKNNTGFKS